MELAFWICWQTREKSKMRCLTLLLLLYLTQWIKFLSAHKNTSSFTFYPVGIIIDMESPIGKIGNMCSSMAISDFYATYAHHRTRLFLHVRDSMGEPLHALSSGINLLENQKVEAIIGPQTSEEAELLVRLGEKAKIPIISFSVTSPFLSPTKTPYFVRVATNDKSQVGAISSIIQAFRWREIIVIHEDTVYGHGIIADLILGLQEIEAHVPYHSLISPLATDDLIGLELYKLMTMSATVFVVHMSPSLASRFFLKVKELGMMSEGYAWIVTDGVTNNLNLLDSSVIDSMQGVIGIRTYTPFSDKLKDFNLKWSGELHKESLTANDNNVNVHCLWAYDAVWALAAAAEKVNNSTSLSHIGSELVKVISRKKFEGLSGEIELKNGELQPMGLQIVNIVEQGVKEIGFWTRRNGLSKTISNMNNTNPNSVEGLNFGIIRWPGKSKAIPKSWKMSTSSGKKLRIGVPIRSGFPELVKMEVDSQTNETTLTGFCIDVFQTAADMLPYSLAYDLIPININDGQLRNYDDVIQQVYLQKFDAAVGDITITANRMQYVDFTIPFTELGTGIIVLDMAVKTRSMWIFMKPFTLDLWLVGAAFFILTGFVVSLIEHGLHKDFKNKPLQQLGFIFYLSSSTLVFAQWEKLKSVLSKFVVVVWLFVAFILTSSYTASLSSLLTLDQLQKLPQGGSIAFPGSFPTKDVFNKSDLGAATLKPLATVAEYYNALRERSKNNSISGLIDEITYVKLFVAKYPHRHTMIPSSYQSNNGFGFAFPKGTQLAADFSAAIAKLREDGKLDLMERKWFQNHEAFKSQDSQPAANVLNFHSFRGLFLVTGFSSIIALSIFYLFTVKRSRDEERSRVDIQTI